MFKWVRISPEIDWYHYQGACLAPTLILRRQTLIKTAARFAPLLISTRPHFKLWTFCIGTDSHPLLEFFNCLCHFFFTPFQYSSYACFFAKLRQSSSSSSAEFASFPANPTPLPTHSIPVFF